MRKLQKRYTKKREIDNLRLFLKLVWNRNKITSYFFLNRLKSNFVI